MPDQREIGVLVRRMATHSWIWGGVGLLLRGKTRPQLLTGLGFLAYGLYDLKNQFEREDAIARGEAVEPPPQPLFVV